MRDFRFSFNISGFGDRDAFIERCRAGERYGYDAMYAPDHLGAGAPFPLLVAAAEATSRMRVGTLVLNAEFWNAALLAREVATTDILTDGRLDLGLGAGHMKWEFDAAGVPWRPLGTRIDGLATMIADLERLFSTDFEDLPPGRAALHPVQRTGFNGSGPPLIIGGTGDRILRLAATHADVVGVAGLFQVKGAAPGKFRLTTAAEADERIKFARACAGDRADSIEWQVLVQRVVQTDDRHAAARELADEINMPVEDVLETPYLLIGTVSEMADQLLRSRERYGFSAIAVLGTHMEALAPVIERLHGRHG
jgi:probable F420-dependent oxidoreductase